MAARSLRSGIIKTGDSIQRATRRNTILLKTENGFQQARQIDKRHTLNLMLPTCSPPKRKRKESPVKRLIATTSSEEKKIENIIKAAEVVVQVKPLAKEKCATVKKVEKDIIDSSNNNNNNNNCSASTELETMKRTPRIASLNAIVKVNAVLDSFVRTTKKMDVATMNRCTERNDAKRKDKLHGRTVVNTENISDTKHRKKLPSEKKKHKYVNIKPRSTHDGKKEEMHAISKLEETYNTQNKKDRKIVENRNSCMDGKDSIDMDIINGEPTENKLKVSELTGKINNTKKYNQGRDIKGNKVEVSKVVKNSSKKPILSKETSVTNKGVMINNVKGISDISKGQRVINQVNQGVMSKTEVLPQSHDNISEVSDSESVPYDMSSPESMKDLNDCTIKETSEQAVQTEVNDKSVQTNTKHLPKRKNKQLCTCKLESESNLSISHYNPVNSDIKAKPFHVKSTVLAHNNNHTLVVPIKKRHVLKEKENEYSKPTITDNISTLLGACINNTLLQNNNTCSKLVYLAKYKEKSTSKKPNTETKRENPKSSHLQVPKINIGSSSDEKGGGNDNKMNLKGSQVASTKQKKSPLGRKRKCNGWQFEGDPKEEPYTLGSQVITRRHYESIWRNNEVLRIHDAVLLKSGLGKGQGDYVARIAMFWEDLSGPHASDMMMSMYWYYKPEQTSYKFSDTSEMEMYASKHRDDNSVACIVEKCYVISFTQFCRFQAQKMLLKEKIKKQLKVVPENKNLQSRFLPSPDVEESIVFFCRYGYEYRSGKLIKGI